MWLAPMLVERVTRGGYAATRPHAYANAVVRTGRLRSSSVGSQAANREQAQMQTLVMNAQGNLEPSYSRDSAGEVEVRVCPTEVVHAPWTPPPPRPVPHLALTRQMPALPSRILSSLALTRASHHPGPGFVGVLA